MRTLLLATWLLLAVPFAAPAQAPAQANRSGFFVGLDPLTYAWISGREITGGQSRGGAGLALRFGWGFTDRLSLILDVPVTELGVADTADFLMSHGDVALRYIVATLPLRHGLLAPFVQVGAGFRELESNYVDDTGSRLYILEGEAFSAGGGAALYVSPQIAVVAAVWASVGRFNDERIGNTTTHRRGYAGTSYRVQVGLEWHKHRAPRCRC